MAEQTTLYMVTISASVTRAIWAVDVEDAQRQTVDLIFLDDLGFKSASELEIRVN